MTTSCISLCTTDGLKTRQRKDKNRSRNASKGDLPVNPYHVLQIRRDATPQEIRQSYKRLALWHHPGRTHESLEERQRRLKVFEILAASYETLIHPETRRQYDFFARDVETSILASGVKGEMFVGGKRLLTSAPSMTPPTSPTRTIARSGNNSVSEPNHRSDNKTPPPLSRTSTQSSSEDGNEDMSYLACSPPSSVCSNHQIQARSLVDASSSGSKSDDEEAETHYTEETTNRLFGGPLAHMYRVRNFEPFTDPFQVFEKVFGSQVFHVKADEIGMPKNWTPVQSPRSAAAGWHGSSHTSQDGKTTVYTTSRECHDRRLTRTETVTVDPATGKTKTHVAVTSEKIEKEPNSLNEEVNCDETCMLICSHISNRNSPVGTSSATSDEIYANRYHCYHEMVPDGTDCTQSDVYQHWANLFDCNRYTLMKHGVFD